jgi:hypothetical protein
VRAARAAATRPPTLMGILPFADSTGRAVRLSAARDETRQIWVDLTRTGLGGIPRSQGGLVLRAVKSMVYDVRHRKDWDVTVRVTTRFAPTVSVSRETFATREAAARHADDLYGSISADPSRIFDWY